MLLYREKQGKKAKDFFEADILKAYEASGYKESFFSTEDVLVLEK